MDKKEYEKNPHAYWGAPLADRGSDGSKSRIPDISQSPIWVKHIKSEIILNNRYNLCLDLGCGGGRYIGHTAEYFTKVIGIDFSEYNIEIAKRNYASFDNVSFIVANLAKINSILDNSVDFAYSVAVFTHIPKDTKKLALKELARVLRFEGCAILIEIVPLIEGAFDCPDITRDEWISIIDEAGLRLIKDEDASPFRKYKIARKI